MTNTPTYRIALATLGYEVTSSGSTLHAYKGRGQSLAYEMVIDGSGQLRFTTTRLVEPSQVVQPKNVTRPYRITREQQSIITVIYELRESDDLREVIQEMERLVNF